MHREICAANSEYSKDIKAALTIAVYLAEPEFGSFMPDYPLFKLGDFGLALSTNMGDPLNPMGYSEFPTQEPAPVCLYLRSCIG